MILYSVSDHIVEIRINHPLVTASASPGSTT